MNTGKKFMVGSTNPVKVNAVKLAIGDRWPTAEVIGVNVASGVHHQPMTDAETHRGAVNRARAALRTTIPKNGVFGVGLEGGVFVTNQVMWTTVWCVLVDDRDNEYEANGARIKVPDEVAKKILAGMEMGDAIAEITKIPNIKQEQGMFGLITRNFVDRTEEYTAIAKMTIGLWYGVDWRFKNLR